MVRNTAKQRKVQFQAIRGEDEADDKEGDGTLQRHKIEMSGAVELLQTHVCAGVCLCTRARVCVWVGG